MIWPNTLPHGPFADIPRTAWPVADAALTQEILDIVQQASHYRQLKKVSSHSAPHNSMNIQY
jgi:hypothetical protein